MKKTWISYIGFMIAIFGLIAFFSSDLSMAIGGFIFAFAGLGMPFGAVVALIISCLLIFVLFGYDFLLSAIMALGFIIPGLYMGKTIKRKAPLSVILGGGTLLRGIFVALSYYRLSIIEGTTIKNLLAGAMPEEIKQQFLNIGYPEELMKTVEETWKFMGEMIPSVIIISALSFTLLVMLIFKFMTRRTPIVFQGIRKLRNIKMDASVTVTTILLFVACFFVKGDFLIILINFLYLMFAVYTYGGIAYFIRSFTKIIRPLPISILITAGIGMVSFGMAYVVMGIVSSFMPIKGEVAEKITSVEENIEDETGKDE